VSDSQRKAGNALSVSSPVLDKERMSPGHWLWSALCVPFSASTLIARWQEEYPARKNSIPLICRRSPPEQLEEEDPKGNQLTDPGSPGKIVIKRQQQ